MAVEETIQEDDSALEETARAKLGVERWDRPLIFSETAEAATDTRLPYWSVLVLSGAIATLGLALNNAAVVIGAMLIAPLLAPTMGLALGLAMGDVRLASQSFIAIAVSTFAVIAVAAILTLLLPFHTFTPEITARTRPTTLDLGIAVFSGLAGAVVSVTRRHGLSAAIPGVAVAVALIPPIAVTGFSVGATLHWSYIKGSLLLYGANLAGIVFSGTVVFLLIGMHRPGVVASAREWHASVKPTRLAAWAARMSWLPSIGTIKTPAARIALVVAFVIALGIPLTITLGEIARETRVHRAVARAAEMFEVEGRSSVLSLEPVVGERESRALLRIATTEWYGDNAKDRFEREASIDAREPVRLILEQIPTSSGELGALTRLFPSAREPAEPTSSASLGTLLEPAKERIDRALDGLSLPDETNTVGAELMMGEPAKLTVGYIAPRPFSDDVAQILRRQLRMALSAPELEVAWRHVSPDTLLLAGSPSDSTALAAFSGLLEQYEGLQLSVMADTASGVAISDSAVALLVRLGAPPDRILLRREQGGGLRIAAIPQQKE